MTPFVVVSGRMAPLPEANIDTDVIMPKQFLKGIDREGLDLGVFYDRKMLPDGRPDPAFVLNRPEWRGSAFLVVGPNFGCGSSREHAVWGLAQIGVRAIFATSFAGIFYDNCARNGLLAVTLPEPDLAPLMRDAETPPRNLLVVDLPAQVLRLTDGRAIAFQVPASQKVALIKGLDPIGMTLERQAEIAAFEAAHLQDSPWLDTHQP